MVIAEFSLRTRSCFSSSNFPVFLSWNKDDVRAYYYLCYCLGARVSELSGCRCEVAGKGAQMRQTLTGIQTDQ